MKRTIAGVALLIGAVLFLLYRAARAAPSSPSTGFELVVWIAVSLLVFLDLIDITVRLQSARLTASPGGTSIPLDVGTFTEAQMKLHLKPWALIVSVHNLEYELEAFLESMAPQRVQLWLIDDASTDDTFPQLRRRGINCIRGTVNRKKPGALKELLRHLPPEIATIGILDPDVHIRTESATQPSHIEGSLFLFQRSGCAAMCPRIEVRQDGWLARLQGLEYGIRFVVGIKMLVDV